MKSANSTPLSLSRSGSRAGRARGAPAARSAEEARGDLNDSRTLVPAIAQKMSALHTGNYIKREDGTKI